jgi:hypothetical protein
MGNNQFITPRSNRQGHRKRITNHKERGTNFMTNYSTTISKDYYGLNAITEINLNKMTDEGAMMLRVTSSKRHSGTVSTTASVIYRKADGCFSTMVFQDYSKTIAQAKLARVTEKSLSEFHAKALEAVPAALVEVAAQYGLEAQTRAPHVMNDALDFHEAGADWSSALAMANID